jgi:basic amino acid/polyamine antiporter, APA family
VIFAAAFDRILPERVADVSETKHVPVWALILMLVPSIIVSAFYAYTSAMKTWIIDATLVIAVTFLGSAIAATILPWRKKHLYDNSAIAKYKVLGIPLITLTGGATALFLGWNLYKWLWPPFNSSSGNLYAINVPDSLWFMGSMYGLALIVYLVAKFYRKRQGIDLKAIYQEIPVE